MDSVMAGQRTEQMKTKTPKKNGGGGGFVSRSSSENFDNFYGGILQPYPSSLSLCVFNHHYRQNQQPPLLPLPIPAVQHPLLSRSLSSSSTRRNRSLTPKKSKQAKREEVKRDLKSASRSISELLTVNPLGPDPNDLPKRFPLVLTAMSGNLETLSDLAPPPSSLPLPKFSVRPKLSCNAEAAGIDTGATDNLRRLLRLR